MRPLGSASVGEHDKLLGCRDQVPACCGSFSKTQLTFIYKPHSKCSESKCSTKQQEWKRLALESELTKLKRELYITYRSSFLPPTPTPQPTYTICRLYSHQQEVPAALAPLAQGA